MTGKAPAALLLGAVPHVGVPMARCLAAHGIDVVAGGLEGREPMLRCRPVRAIVTLPDPGAPGFLSELLALIERERIELVMPCSDVALRALVTVRQRTAALPADPCAPSPRAVEIVLDKGRTFDAARACGVETPAQHAIVDIESMYALRDRLHFPLIAKPSHVGGAPAAFKIRYLKDFNALRSAVSDDPAFGRTNVIQEYVVGEGFGVAMLRHAGRIVAAFAHRRLKELPASGGVSVLHVAEMLPPDALRAATGLLEAIDWEGPALVEFRRRSDGSFVLMEINGRYWGSVGLPIAAGIEFPWYHWQIAHGAEPDPPLQYRVGLRMRWLTGDVSRLIGVWRGKPRDALVKPNVLRETARFIADFDARNLSSLAARGDPFRDAAEIGVLASHFWRRAGHAAVVRLFPQRRRRAASLLFDLGPRPLARYAARCLRPRDRGPRLCDLRPRTAPPGSFLFVCSGNAMRSPFSEALLRDAAARRGLHIDVGSAGVRAVDGKPAHPWARALASEFGISLDAHRGRLLTREIAARYDAIVVYDFFNEVDVLARFPELRPKLYLMRSCDPDRAGGAEIFDPDGTTIGELHAAYQTIARCQAGLIECIASAPAGSGIPDSIE